jgi:threonine/homoserine/homoserine lactone efflux protein
MLEFENFHLFILASLVLNLTPGNDMLFVISRTMSCGIKGGLYSSLGVFLGCLVHVVFATIGLSALVMKFSIAYEIIRYLGAAYLIYFGLMSFITRKDNYTNEIILHKPSSKKLVIQGIITDVLNPKVAIFFLAFLSQFVNQHSENVWFQFLFLGILFNVIGTLIFLGIVYIVYKTSHMLKNTFFWRYQEKIAGTVLIGLGLNMALDNKE